MNLPRQPIIVVLGMMTRMPVGGVIWQTVHYLEGLRRLGFNVFYAEDHGLHPAMFTDDDDPDGGDKAAAFIAMTLEEFGLGGRQWSYHAWHGEERYYGIGKNAIESAMRRAEAVINLHGGTIPREEHRAGGALIYLETDPVAPEVELYSGVEATRQFLDAHTAHFTFGENLGAADCKVPAPTRYRFYPTRQPVICDFWRDRINAPGDCFTTIANWRQAHRQMTLEGEAYHWSKHYEFEKFLELPERSGQAFELALSSYEEADREKLESKGWRVRNALEFSREPHAYRDYICSSRGEWTVAKDQNVRLRSGWFSDRAATYLAAGRPVVTQETGFSNLLPTGRGLFAFSTMDEIVSAIREITSDYNAHSRAAQEIAQDYFDAETVLSRLLSDAGISKPS